MLKKVKFDYFERFEASVGDDISVSFMFEKALNIIYIL
jgi:hypothetical protein